MSRPRLDSGGGAAEDAGDGSGTVDPLARAVADFQAGIDRERSFRLLFERFHKPVKGFFAARVSAEDAFDLTQQTFLALYKGLDDFRGDSELATWIFRITRNHHYQWLRRRRVRKDVDQPSPLAGDEDRATPEVVDRRRSPEAQAVDEDSLRLLRQAIETLPAQMRRCLRHRIYDELSYREIAETMGISIQTVKAHLFQARGKLKGLLSKRFTGIDF